MSKKEKSRTFDENNFKNLLTFAKTGAIMYKAFGREPYVSGCGAVGSLREKTIDYRFLRCKSLKQGVGEASVLSDKRRLCDGVFSPTGRAEPFQKVRASHKFKIQ